MDEINNTTNCKLCGAPLNKKELMTSEIYDDAICDICMGKQRRTELAKDNYRNKLATVPSVYTECKWNEQSLSPWYGKSSVITAEESPLVGTQLAWDLIKLNWRNGKDAIYASSKDIAIEYASIPWQHRKEYIDKYAECPGLLAIDDINRDAVRDILSRILEYRAERELDTVIVLHIPYDEIPSVLGDKVASLISKNWKHISMERK